MSSLTSSQLSTLMDMLTYCRPHGSFTDRAFCAKYIATLPGIVQDEYGNWIADIGDDPRVLWSSHTDTVHRHEGRQTIHVDTETQMIALSKKSRNGRSNCLGADDTIGVFLMREMYLSGVHGRYIFHYGEECGCIGSGDLARYSPERLNGIKFAIALDRAGTSDVITSQMGGECCSLLFACSLINALGLPYLPACGVYTDTAEYMDLVPECTNLSVGYYDQHTSRETVDYAHVGTLLSALVTMDQSVLVCDRDPFAPKPKWGKRFSWETSKTSTHVDTLARDYRPEDFGGITRMGGKTPVPLWRDSYGWTDWCLVCDAPVIDTSDPDFDDSDHCICPREDEDDLAAGMSEDDLKFLRYLQGLD